MRNLVLILSLVGTVTWIAPADAGTITYTDRATFQSALGASVTDDYSAAGYQHGDRYDGPTTEYFTNAAMSAVVGETDYQSTRSPLEQMNLIAHDPANDYYCGGCNGSFRLLFDTTSVGTASGVYGAGFNYLNDAGPDRPLYQAFVTFGDATTANYQLARNGQQLFPSFFGIASDLGISSIHLGLADGQSTHDGSFAIDNLTIGAAGAAQSVPDRASSLALLSLALTVLLLAKGRGSLRLPLVSGAMFTKATPRILAVCAALCVAAPAAANTIVDTGTPSGSANYSFRADVYFAGQFSTTDSYLVQTIEGYFGNQYSNATSEVTIGIHAHDQSAPGGLLVSDTVSLVPRAALGWYGVTGLNYLLAPGTYWASFRPSALGYGSMPGIAPNPLTQSTKASGDYDWDNTGASDLKQGVRITGDLVPQSVPDASSASTLLVIAGLVGFAVHRRLA